MINKNTTKNISIEKLFPFEGHPFKVQDNEEMNTLIESIHKNCSFVNARDFGCLVGKFLQKLSFGIGFHKEIAGSITKELIQEKLKIFNRSLKQDFAISAPRIAVLSLNPHAGDGGLLGTEEQEISRTSAPAEGCRQ